MKNPINKRLGVSTWVAFSTVLVAITVFGMIAHLVIISDGALAWKSVVEAACFSVSTVTSVGYGDWLPYEMDKTDQSGMLHAERVQTMKAASIPLMLFGATFYAFLVGAAANIFTVRW